MTKGLTEKEIKELLRVFSPIDVEIIISKFSAKDIRRVINQAAEEE